MVSCPRRSPILWRKTIRVQLQCCTPVERPFGCQVAGRKNLAPEIGILIELLTLGGYSRKRMDRLRKRDAKRNARTGLPGPLPRSGTAQQRRVTQLGVKQARAQQHHHCSWAHSTGHSIAAQPAPALCNEGVYQGILNWAGLGWAGLERPTFGPVLG